MIIITANSLNLIKEMKGLNALSKQLWGAFRNISKLLKAFACDFIIINKSTLVICRIYN